MCIYLKMKFLVKMAQIKLQTQIWIDFLLLMLFDISRLGSNRKPIVSAGAQRLGLAYANPNL